MNRRRVHGGFETGIHLALRRRRYDALHDGGGLVFENAGGIALLVANNLTARRIPGVAIQAGELQRQRIGFSVQILPFSRISIADRPYALFAARAANKMTAKQIALRIVLCTPCNGS